MALGAPGWDGLSTAAEHYRAISRKRIVAARDVPSGTVLVREDVTFKRADHGLSPAHLDQLLGRRLNRAISKDTGITNEDLE